MATVKISIVQKNPSIIFKKKNDLWIWFFAILFCVCGIALSVLFSILLRISYQDGNTPLPAYSGAIVAGFALSLAGLTQILVFIQKKKTKKEKD